MSTCNSWGRSQLALAPLPATSATPSAAYTTLCALGCPPACILCTLEAKYSAVLAYKTQGSGEAGREAANCTVAESGAGPQKPPAQKGAYLTLDRLGSFGTTVGAHTEPLKHQGMHKGSN